MLEKIEPLFRDSTRRCTKLGMNTPDHIEPYQVLYHKLKKIGLHLSKWSRGMFSKAKFHLHATRLVILHLDIG